MQNLFYTILNGYALFILLIIGVVFFSKQRLKQLEDNTYGRLIIVCITTIFFGVLGGIALYLNASELILQVLNKVYLAGLVAIIALFADYGYIISNPIDKATKMQKKVMIFIAINSLIILLLPLEIILTPEVINKGIGVTYSYCVMGIFYIYLIALLLSNTENLRQKKYLPLILLIFAVIIITILQMLNPAMNFLINPLIVMNSLIMYFTIENPDVKMLEQVEIARQQADKANQAKTDFLSNMSHEIRTPLNAIVGFSQALSEEDCLNNEAQDEVKDIMMASENLLEIVNGILDISKIESGKLEIISKDYSFKKLCDEVVALGRGRLGDKPLDFRTVYDESIPEVLYGDSTRIKEVIVNILTNAIKYTKEGFVELKVSSVIKDDVCRLIISVEDSGIGIKQENIEKLFNKFERIGVEKEITIEGTGLGLAITKKLVDLMKGTIVVQSIYGKGSKFTISIDQKIQVGHHIEETQTVNLEDMITVDLSNKRVLVVDDNMVNLKVAARLLKDYNLIIDEVESGADCINKVMSDVKYDLILMDDMMPKMSGTECLHHLQELDGFNIPTIALTANAISGMREKYLSEGFNDYLAKPIDRKELNKIIKNYLAKEKE